MVDAQNKTKTVASSRAPARKGGAGPGDVKTGQGTNGTGGGGGAVARSPGFSGTVCVAFDANAGCHLGRRGRLPWTRNGTSRHAGKWRRYNGSRRRLAHFVRAGKPERRGDTSDPQGDCRGHALSGRAGNDCVCTDRGERQRKAGNTLPNPEPKDAECK